MCLGVPLLASALACLGPCLAQDVQPSPKSALQAVSAKPSPDADTPFDPYAMSSDSSAFGQVPPAPLPPSPRPAVRRSQASPSPDPFSYMDRQAPSSDPRDREPYYGGSYADAPPAPRVRIVDIVSAPSAPAAPSRGASDPSAGPRAQTPHSQRKAQAPRDSKPEAKPGASGR